MQKYIWDHWSRYIDNNWLNYRRNDMFCPELKIKWLLDGCGNYWLDGHTTNSGIISSYKELKIGNNEISWSACSDMVLERLEEDDIDDESELMLPGAGDETNEAPKLKKPPTPAAQEPKFLKMRKMFVDGDLVSRRVNTDNGFEYNGEHYTISNAVQLYHPKQTRYGLLYDADTVYVFKPHNTTEVRLFAQDLSS